MINILAHYRFEGNADDSSVHGNNAILGTPAPATSVGKLGNGYQFSIPNPKTIVTPIPSNDLNPPFFFSCWIYPQSISGSSSTSGIIICRRYDNDNSMGFIVVRNNTISLSTGIGEASFISSPTISSNTWYYVCGVWSNDGNAYLYVNGILVAQGGYSFIATSYHPITIGSYKNGAFGWAFVGVIDEVIIGKGVPSLPDIKRMMMGLRPLDIDPQPFYADVQIYKNLVLADGGIFEEDVFYQCYSSGKRVVRKEANVWIVPGAYKTGIIYGINVVTKTLVQFTYSRSGVATYYDKNGILQTAAANIPRIDYDPVTKQLRGYLFENAATNLISNSLLDGNITGWNAITIDVTYNTGTTSYGRPFLSVIKTTTGQSASLSCNSITSVSNTVYSFRVTLRADTANKAHVGIGPNPDGGSGIWGTNSDAGGRIVSGPGNIARSEGSLYTITNLSNTEDTVVEVYRKYNNSGITSRGFIYPDLAGSTVIGAGVKISTPQLETNALGVCTSQIDTNGSTQTRATETLVSQSDLINDAASSIYIEGSRLSDGISGSRMFSRTESARIWYAVNNPIVVSMYDGTTIINATNQTNGQTIKVAASIGPEGQKINRNTAVVKGSYDGTFGSGNVALAGGSDSPGRVQNYLKSFAIIHRQLTDSEHIELTR